jgi:hypothetical protein
MVDYRPSDVLSMEDFGLSWRLTDARWSAQPVSILRRITPLAPPKSRALYEGSPLALSVGSPREIEGLRVVRRRSLADDGDSESDRTRQWLRELPIDPSREVYVCWGLGDGVAAVTDWGTFVAIWDDLWYPLDRVCIFDEARDWAIVFGPEEEVSFWAPASRPVDPALA